MNAECQQKSPAFAYLSAIALVLIALGLRIGLAVRSSNLCHPDEIYQTQEPAHRLAYGFGVVTWEYRLGVRSWVFPGFLAGVMRATEWIGGGSSGYRLGVVVVLSLLSLVTVWFGWAWAKRAIGVEGAIIAGALCATWIDLVYFAPKALPEVVAGHMLLPGLYLGIYGERLQEDKRMFLAGIFCGLAASLRVQLIPAVAFAAVYFCHSNWRKRIPGVTAGLLLPVALFGLLDSITWSYPFQSFLLYIRANVFEGRSAPYGTRPWYWYLACLLVLLGPVVFAAILGARRSPFLGWISLTILVPHSFVGLKEVRFIYPLLPIVVTLAALGIAELIEDLRSRPEWPRLLRFVVVTVLVLWTIARGVMGARFAGWFEGSGSLVAFDQLSRESALCGVGLYRVSWFNSGGYTYLHRNVPIVILPEGSRFDEETPGINAVVTLGALAEGQGDFKLVGCWNGVCLYRRPGSCVSHPKGELNDWLRRTGN